MRPRDPTWVEFFLSDHPRRRRWTERVVGAEERNCEKLQRAIEVITRWDAAQIYCGGTPLTESHLFRVHSIACAGRPLVVLAAGEQYDAERWAEIAHVPQIEGGGACCVIS